MQLSCDHRPTLFLWSRRGQILLSFFMHQVVITKTQSLNNLYTEGKKLAFSDLLSKQVPIEKTRTFQIEQKTIT